MNKFIKKSFQSFSLWFVILIFCIQLLRELFNFSFVRLGTHPRHWDEWYGIFTGALIHSNWTHLLNNSYPLLITGLFLYFIFEQKSNLVFLISYILTGLFIFLFARGNTYHIGASGVVYSWAFMLTALGLLRKDRVSIGLGLGVILLFGSMIWGLFPIEEGVSWDGHLMGAFSGILNAYIFRNVNLKKTPIQASTSDDYQFEQYNYDDFGYLKRQKEEKRNLE